MKTLSPRERTSTHQLASGTTASGMVLAAGTSGSSVCSSGFVGNCISGGGGELPPPPPPAGLGLRLGDREALCFLSRFTGDLRRGDGDLVLRLQYTNSKQRFCICVIKDRSDIKMHFSLTSLDSLTGPSLGCLSPSYCHQLSSETQASPVQSRAKWQEPRHHFITMWP